MSTPTLTTFRQVLQDFLIEDSEEDSEEYSDSFGDIVENEDVVRYIFVLMKLNKNFNPLQADDYVRIFALLKDQGYLVYDDLDATGMSRRDMKNGCII